MTYSILIILLIKIVIKIFFSHLYNVTDVLVIEESAEQFEMDM